MLFKTMLPSAAVPGKGPVVFQLHGGTSATSNLAPLVSIPEEPPGRLGLQQRDGGGEVDGGDAAHELPDGVPGGVGAEPREERGAARLEPVAGGGGGGWKRKIEV